MKKLLAFICATSMLVASVSSVPVLAEENGVCDKTIVEEPIVTATYLITDCYLWVSKNGTTLYINAQTKCDSTMKSVGFKDIVVQYSFNQSDWYTYTTIGDILNSSTSTCYLDDYPVPVTNGYYYRVTLNHYAKESGWFGSSQSVPNTSNVVS